MPAKNVDPQKGKLRDVYEVLREKEIAARRVAREVEILRLVAPLLADETDEGFAVPAPATERKVASTRKAGPRASSPASQSDDSAEKPSSAAKISVRLKRLATPFLNASRALASTFG